MVLEIHSWAIVITAFAFPITFPNHVPQIGPRFSINIPDKRFLPAIGAEVFV